MRSFIGKDNDDDDEGRWGPTIYAGIQDLKAKTEEEFHDSRGNIEDDDVDDDEVLYHLSEEYFQNGREMGIIQTNLFMQTK